MRSLSKFIGPDIAVALVASDAETENRLAMRLSPGTTWVSHLLQRIAHALLTDDAARAQIQRAGAHYAQRNADFAAHLAEHGMLAQPGDGLMVCGFRWVRPRSRSRKGSLRRGWRVRPGDEFRFADSSAVSHRLRITVHALSDAEAAALAVDLACAVAEARARG